MENKEPTPIPEQVLNQLNEYSQGFILCYVDENGNPQLVTQSDNFSFMLGMQSTLIDWLEAHKMVRKDMHAAEIVSCDCPNCSEEEED